MSPRFAKILEERRAAIGKLAPPLPGPDDGVDMKKANNPGHAPEEAKACIAHIVQKSM